MLHLCILYCYLYIKGSVRPWQVVCFQRDTMGGCVISGYFGYSFTYSFCQFAAYSTLYILAGGLSFIHPGEKTEQQGDVMINEFTLRVDAPALC